MARARFLFPSLLLTVALFLVTASPFGCGTDDVGPQSSMVGGRCTTDKDCVKRCLTDAQAFPGGYCTVSCATNNDCPGGSACVAISGGVCLATCQVARDCDAYGPGYQCDRRTSQAMGSGAGPLACAGN